MDQVFQFIADHYETILAVIGAAAVVAAATPNDVDNKIVKVLNDIVNLVAMNVGNAKNADSENE